VQVKQVSITETGQTQTVCGKLANHLDATAVRRIR